MIPLFSVTKSNPAVRICFASSTVVAVATSNSLSSKWITAKTRQQPLLCNFKQIRFALDAISWLMGVCWGSGRAKQEKKGMKTSTELFHRNSYPEHIQPTLSFSPLFFNSNCLLATKKGEIEVFLTIALRSFS